VAVDDEGRLASADPDAVGDERIKGFSSEVGRALRSDGKRFNGDSRSQSSVFVALHVGFHSKSLAGTIPINRRANMKNEVDN
jgi:hypothetical protein